MREKYESLSLATLKELAKARGLKKISVLRKQALIELMLEEDEKDAQKKKGQAAETVKERVKNTSELRPEKVQKPAAAQIQNTEEKKSVSVPAVSQKSEAQDNGAQRTYKNEYKQDRSSGEGGEKKYYTNNRYQNNQGRFAGRHQNNQSRYQSNAQRYQNNPARHQERSQSNQERGQNNQDRHQNNQEQISQGKTQNSQNFQEKTQSSPNQNSQEHTQNNTSIHSQDHTTEAGQSRYEERQERYPDKVQERYDDDHKLPPEAVELDSGEKANGILEVLPDGYGFIRCENYLPGENDVYVSPSQIRRFNLKTGDILTGSIRIKTQGEKFSALLFVESINGYDPSEGYKRYNFENMTPIFPNRRLVMERPGGTVAMRIVDLISPIGKGQRGMIVSPPKAGKTTLLKDVAKSILRNSPSMHLIILLIDERPEEVTDIKEAIQGSNVEVIYSTFDELPEHHKRVSEMVVERARRLVEHRQDVTILLDSITRLARAYNLCVPPSGRTLSGGLDPAALHMPKRFFGAARNMREGGSLTILATALVDTGSKMDDVIYEEFKGTGNMELVLDRKLQEKRVFPAIDIQKSGTRREDLLLSREELEVVDNMRRALNGLKADEAVEQILNMFSRTRSNAEFVHIAQKQKF